MFYFIHNNNYDYIDTLDRHLKTQDCNLCAKSWNKLAVFTLKTIDITSLVESNDSIKIFSPNPVTINLQ